LSTKETTNPTEATTAPTKETTPATKESCVVEGGDDQCDGGDEQSDEGDGVCDEPAIESYVAAFVSFVAGGIWPEGASAAHEAAVSSYVRGYAFSVRSCGLRSAQCVSAGGTSTDDERDSVSFEAGRCCAVERTKVREAHDAFH